MRLQKGIRYFKNHVTFHNVTWEVFCIVMCVHEKNFPLQWLVVSKSQQGAAVFFAKTTQVYQQVLNNRLRSA